MGTEIVYINGEVSYDNSIDLILKENGTALTALQMATITAMGLVYQGTEYKSGDYAAAFDFTTYADDAKVILKPQKITGIAAGRDPKAEVVVYDPSNPNGIVWDTIDLMIQDVSDYA